MLPKTFLHPNAVQWGMAKQCGADRGCQCSIKPIFRTAKMEILNE